jgi:hypothetical protein
MGSSIKLHGSYSDLISKLIGKTFRYAKEDKYIVRRIIAIQNNGGRTLLQVDNESFNRTNTYMHGKYTLDILDFLVKVQNGTYIWIKQ